VNTKRLPPSIPSLSEVLKRPVIFVSGKGGVGKSVWTQAIALALSKKGKRTLWVDLEDPLRPRGQLVKVGPKLWHLNCDAEMAFEEYALLKIGDSPLARLFIDNKLMRYLAKAAPGIHELVLLGKIWHESSRYECVVVDMPATGHGLALFQSTKNYATLFRGGPIHEDAEEMIHTFADPLRTGHIVLALPEEMPLQESLDLDLFLLDLFPNNRATFIVNRTFPKSDASPKTSGDPKKWTSPVAQGPVDYLHKRILLEEYNLRIWRDQGISFAEFNYVPPAPSRTNQLVSETLAHQLELGRYV